MSNFKYKIENGKCYLIIGKNRIRVEWKERYVPKEEDIEIVPYDFEISPTTKTFTNFSGSQKMTCSWKGEDPDVEEAPDLVWETSNDKIAVIRKTGKNVYIDPVVYTTIPQDNTATITASFPNYPDVKTTCVVTSNVIVPTSITLNTSSLNMQKNTTETLTATISPNTAIDSLVWESSDTSVATVNETGVVTCLENATISATCTITCKSLYDSTKSATCTVTVVDQPPEGE